jgi:hypothetical protein
MASKQVLLANFLTVTHSESGRPMTKPIEHSSGIIIRATAHL